MSSPALELQNLTAISILVPTTFEVLFVFLKKCCHRRLSNSVVMTTKQTDTKQKQRLYCRSTESTCEWQHLRFGVFIESMWPWPPRRRLACGQRFLVLCYSLTYSLAIVIAQIVIHVSQSRNRKRFMTFFCFVFMRNIFPSAKYHKLCTFVSTRNKKKIYRAN